MAQHPQLSELLPESERESINSGDRGGETMARLGSVVRWCGGWRERRARRQKQLRLRRQHSGGTVWLGRRRRSCGRLAVSRLVRWRLVAELLRPIRKALMEMVAGAALAGSGSASAPGRRQLVTLPQLNFPFVGTLTLPAIA